MLTALLMLSFFSHSYAGSAAVKNESKPAPVFESVDINACVATLEQELAEIELAGIPDASCKVTLSSLQTNDDEECKAIIEYTYACSPGAIQGEGSGCCPR